MRYLDRVYLVFEARKTATLAEVETVAARLGLTFPDGYAEYVTELGEGMLSGFLRVWLPEKVENDLSANRQLLIDHFFWDEDGPLSPSRARETLMVGDTMNGDSLVFHPEKPEELFVLPRNEDRIFQLGPGLDSAIDWMCDSGVLTQPITCRYFEPDGERDSIQRFIPLTYQTVRDALIELGIHDQIAFEQRPCDEEQLFDVMIEVDDELEEVDEEVAIMLLIQEFGGSVSADNSSSFEGLTEVTITHVPGRTSPKLDQLLGLLDELEGQGRRKKRRKG